jgi:general secretion pathway protein D
VLRLKDGENQVLAGLINDEDRRSANKVPGLGDVPVVGRLFGAQADDRTKTEIVLSITPRVVRNIPRPSAEQQEFETGTEANVGARAGGEGGAAASAGPSLGVTAVGGNATSPTSPSATPSSQPLLGQNAANALAQTGSGVALGAVSPLPVGTVSARWVGPSTARRGDVVALALMVQSDQPVTGVPAVVGFDPRVFQVVDVVEGDWLRQSGGTTSLSTQVDASGQVRLSVSRAGDGLTGAKGDGLLATVRLQVVAGAAAGVSRVQLLGLAPVGVGGRALQSTLPDALPVVVGD